MSETPVTGFPEPEEQRPPVDAHTPGAKPDGKDAAIDALLDLASTHDWPSISLGDVAARAGLTLGALRTQFPSKGAILAAYSRRLDLAVLNGAGSSLAEEPARDRLFDVLMRRLDAMTPHRIALHRIARAVAHDPFSLAALNRVVVTSMQWMLAAAGLPSDGPRGAGQAQALALAWSRVLRVWFEDDVEAGRTMTELDRQLREGERWMQRVDDLDRMTAPLRRFVGRAADRARHRGNVGHGVGSSTATARGGAEAM